MTHWRHRRTILPLSTLTGMVCPGNQESRPILSLSMLARLDVRIIVSLSMPAGLVPGSEIQSADEQKTFRSRNGACENNPTFIHAHGNRSTGRLQHDACDDERLKGCDRKLHGAGVEA